MNYNFIRPKKPTYNKGVLVIHADDGHASDYTGWIPLLKRKAREYSSWHNAGTVVMCSAINTATIGTTGIMTLANLKDMIKNRCEILSHGRHHIGIGENPLAANASAGATRIDIYGAGVFSNAPGNPYNFRIFEGSKEEQFQILTSSGSSAEPEAGFITISTPLVNSYTTAAKVQLTDTSAETLLKGCIDDAKAWGINLIHHVYTYHAGGHHFYSAKSVDWVGQYFKSGRGMAKSNGVAGSIATWDLRNLNSVLNAERTDASIDVLLNEIAQNDGLLIYYGHGETDATSLSKLEHVIDGALSRGIRIKTMTGALEYFGAM